MHILMARMFAFWIHFILQAGSWLPALFRFAFTFSQYWRDAI